MTSYWWRNHIEHAEQLLEMAKADGMSTARRLELIYQTVTELTQSICDLEEHRNDE